MSEERIRKYRYSEIFGHTIQGEGHYAGHPTVWYRAWGCNFECKGFGQDNPDDMTTWDLPFEKVDLTNITKMEDLPVFHRGCDSSYSWSKKFFHLAHKGTPQEIATEIRKYLKNEFNPEGKFRHPKSGQWTHMAFTGGEPMMSQHAVVDIMQQFRNEMDIPMYVTIETNGTQEMRSIFRDFFDNRGMFPGELFWSVSPKLSFTGEKWSEAIQPVILKEYHNVSKAGQLKYVANGTQKTWDEIERATATYREAGINFPIWIMPVGADLEMQNSVAAKIAEQAIERGYNVAARVHVYLFGNVVGK